MSGSSSTGEPAVEPTLFRKVLGTFATGVGVMSTSRDGTPHAMTVSAVSSVSLEPPLVLVCVERSAVMATEVEGAKAFALTFLDEDRSDLSNRFADGDRPMGHEQFEGLATRIEATGAPILEGGLGWVDCRVWNTYDGGDHLIVVGEVLALGEGSSVDPLLYFRSAYRRLAR